MYAIIRAGGKQSKVREGDVIQVELLKNAAEEVNFTPLLVVQEDGTAITDRTALGAASVTARVLGEAKGPKIDIFKYKNKTGYRRRMGHRQRYTELEVTGISMGGKATKPSKAAPKAKKTETPPQAASEEE